MRERKPGKKINLWSYADKRMFPIAQGQFAPQGTLQPSLTIGKVEKVLTKINPSERRPVNLPSTDITYEGMWFYQAFEPTCTVWAIVNAGLVLGQYPSMDCIKKLSNMERIGKTVGLDISNAAEIVNKHAQTFYRLVAIKDLAPLYDEFTNLVIQQLNWGIPVVTSVSSEEYSGVSGEPHAICLAGYRVQNGLMDFQVIDSARGIIWVTRERMERARQFGYNSLYKVVLKSPKMKHP